MAYTRKTQRIAQIPVLSPMLSMIKAKEARGYDDVVAHLRPYKPRNLLSLTLREVNNWQYEQDRRMKAERDRNSNAGEAVGAYQFIKETLAMIVEGSDLSWNDKFSPQIQDEMAIHLLLGRRADEYVAGTLSETEFMNLLAQEWASMPVASRVVGRRGFLLRPGQSYYAGVGNNNALIRPSAVRRSIRRSRALFAEQGSLPSKQGSTSGRNFSSRMKVDASVIKASTTTRVQRGDVKKYQTWLNSNGGRPKLTVDGIVGPNTKASAASLSRDYQKDLRAMASGRGLTVTRSQLSDVRRILSTLPDAKNTVEAYQSFLNLSRARGQQIEEDGLYGPQTHSAAVQQGRNPVSDIRNLSRGVRI